MTLSRQYRDWAEIIGDAMLGPAAAAETTTLSRLKAFHDQLTGFSLHCAASGITIACDSLAPHLATVQGAVSRLDVAIKRAQRIEGLIDGAAKAVALAGALVSGNASAIAAAAHGIA